RRDAQFEEVVDDLLGGEPEERAAVLGWHGRMPGGHALHMALVDDGAVPGPAGPVVVAPRERGIGDDGLRCVGRAVGGAEREVLFGVTGDVAEVFWVQPHGPGE